MNTKEPLWRRFLQKLGLSIMEVSSSISYKDPTRPTGPRDHIRWFVEGIGSRVFGWGFNNSVTQERMILDGEIPWKALNKEDRQKYFGRIEAHVASEDYIVSSIYDMMALDHPAWLALSPEARQDARDHLELAMHHVRDIHNRWDGLRNYKPAQLALPWKIQPVAGKIYTGIELIAMERLRQVTVEEFDEVNDDTNLNSELAWAAAAYVLSDIDPNDLNGEDVEKLPEIFWPWHSDWWKPSTRTRDLTKAGALIAAEIDRLNRDAE